MKGMKYIKKLYYKSGFRLCGDDVVLCCVSCCIVVLSVSLHVICEMNCIISLTLHIDHMDQCGRQYTDRQEG